MSTSPVRIWVMAARVRTLPAAVAPVLVGTSLALGAGHFQALAFLAALLGAIFIQVGTNLSNDYSDARRGADTEDRLGPVRVTAGGLVPPSQVLLATYVSFGAAVLCGVYLVAVAGPELLAVGAASILAGVLYTGGPRPYGYEGLGEVFVFLFFGIVAVVGSYFVQIQELPWQAFVCAVPVGLLASAILVVNNVRDLETDRRAGKRTLAVRLGRSRTRALYTRDARDGVHLRAAAVGVRLDERLAAAAVGLDPARGDARARRAHAQRRPCAERGAREDRDAAARLLPAVRRRHPRRRRRQLVKLEIARRTLALARPLHTSYGEVAERELLIVTLTDSDGVPGYGEAAPLDAYDGVALEHVERALESYRAVLADSAALNGAQLIDACRARRRSAARRSPRSTSRCGIARVAAPGVRSRRCSATTPATHVPVNATLTALDRTAVAEQAARAVQDGFDCIKLKVGVGDDAGRVAADARSGRPARQAAPRRQRRLERRAGGADDRCALPRRPRARRGADARAGGDPRGARAGRGARRDR